MSRRNNNNTKKMIIAASLSRRRDNKGRYANMNEHYIRTPYDYPIQPMNRRMGFQDEYSQPYLTTGTHDVWNEPNRYYDREHHNRHTNDHMSKEETEQYVRRMKHSDGTTGEYFTFEEVKSMLNKKGMFDDPIKVYCYINKMKSKYQSIAKEFGMDNQDFYFKMAIATIKHHQNNK